MSRIVQCGNKTGHTGTQQSTRLYTKPDMSAGGGIKLRVLEPQKPVLSAFAMLMFDSKYVYKGVVKNEREITFEGLPSGKYDLLILYDDCFYEGFHLCRDTNTLTAADQKNIALIVNKSVPFFDTKSIHRCEGFTGQSGAAGIVLQEVRTKPVTLQDASVRADIQIRSLKFGQAEDVGAVGWQMTVTRELVRTEVIPGEHKGLLTHHYHPTIGGIRVTDSVKDLGNLNLKQKP